MGYLVLVRKYRPQTFAEVTGQAPIVQTLQNSISLGRVGHAYLFAGPRGTGKTSIARIFSKALDCKQGPTPEPCNKCITCQEISSGSALDVIEIDGASNRGIDEIRTLRENVKFGPASCRYKIYIIDEVHMLSTEAFNALLKTLEEPPGHIVFILATTDPHKIPETILSRCQRFDFRLISPRDIIQRLEYIAGQEKIEIDRASLHLIMRSAEGSLRDAIGLLEQSVCFKGNRVQLKDIADLLHQVPPIIRERFVEKVIEHNQKDTLNLFNQVTSEGYEVHQFAESLQGYFRNLLLVKISSDFPFLSIPEEELATIKKLSEKFAREQLYRILEELNQAINQMKWSDHPELILELMIIKITTPYISLPEVVKKIESLEEKFSRKEIKREPPPEQIESEGKWAEVLKRTEKENMPLSVALERGKIEQVTEDTIILSFLEKDKFSKERVEQSEQLLRNIIHQIYGKEYKMKCIVTERESNYIPESLEPEFEVEALPNQNEPQSRINSSEENVPEVIKAEPILKDVLEIFEGEIVRKEEK